MALLKRLDAHQIPSLRRDAVDADTLSAAGAIVDDVRHRGLDALREHGERLGDLEPGAQLVYDRAELDAAADALEPQARQVLERAAARIMTFARAQRDSVRDVEVAIAGGRAGQRVAPVEAAGCYAPGGRFPLPSSVLMTAVTARAAGVDRVLVASPRPAPVTLAAAAVAGADALLAVGGAQAIAAMAFGAGDITPCDAVVGPGNRWVTAAKQLVAGHVRIDMLAGPSELVVLADASADADVVVADLLAQAEHDTDAMPVLVTTSADLADAVDASLARQLDVLPTKATAAEALHNGFIVLVDDLAEGVDLCNRLAPEHLQLLTEEPWHLVDQLAHYGGLFVGTQAAEVLGDYGAGPNHTLPTGGTARSAAGLSVFTFLRMQTWMSIEEPERAQELVRDAVALARLEGLEAHARAAEARLQDP